MGFQNFSTIQKPYNTFLRIVRGYESEHLNQSQNSKNNVVCTLFKQPLSNKMFYVEYLQKMGKFWIYLKIIDQI